MACAAATAAGTAGVLLRSLAAASDEAKVLKNDDILLRIDGVEVRGAQKRGSLGIWQGVWSGNEGDDVHS